MSEQVKRYDPFGYDGLSALMHEDVQGDWVRGEDYDALHAEAETLRDENGRLSSAHDDMCRKAAWYAEREEKTRTELEAARGLLAQLRGMINCTVENDTEKMPVWISTKHPVIEQIDTFLTATPAPEVQAEQGEQP